MSYNSENESNSDSEEYESLTMEYFNSSFKNKKLSAENKKKIEHLTTICNDLLKFRKWSKYNMAKITTLISNVDIDEPNFKFNYNKWSQRLDDNYTFYGFIRSMDKNNRMKFVDFYSEEENISLPYVREILTYNALIERYMNEDKWNWYDVLNYDYDKTNEMSHKHGRLHFLHVYEKRLASDNVSYENKLNLYNYIQANITNFDLFR